MASKQAQSVYRIIYMIIYTTVNSSRKEKIRNDIDITK
jgi:hypothetical protein